MGDPYGLPDEDLRRLISSRTTNTLLPPDPLSLHPLNNAPHFPPPPSYDDPIINSTAVVGEVFFPPRAAPFPYYHHYHNPPATITAAATTTTTSTSTSVAAAAADHAFNMDIGERGWLGFDTGTNRWPRQETLSLLEIRSRLDSKFRENNQKAPLWNEISRIMAEEFGYQRSGKKCKEKFENLYKYYKKTKEGKSSRQDGKHYRFFRQLEAICGGSGEPTTTTTIHHHHHDAAGNAGTSVVQTPTFKNINQQDNVNGGDHHDVSLSTFSNSSDQLETSSSENNNNNNNNSINYDEDLSAIAYMMNNNKSKKNKEEKNEQGPSSRRVRRSSRSSWRAKVEEIVGSHMRKIIETQDAWMERMLSAVEQREQEMASREEERKKKESMRFDQQVYELWAKERAWVESRDAALMEVVRKHIGNNNNNNNKEIHHHETLPIEEQQQQRRRSGGRWSEMEISNLMQLRSGFEQRLRENGGYLMENNGNVNWGEIAGKMGCLGYERSEGECKEIWDEISISLGRTVECGAKSTTTRPPWCLGLKLTDDDV